MNFIENLENLIETFADYEVKLVDTAGQDEYSIFPAQYSMVSRGNLGKKTLNSSIFLPGFPRVRSCLLHHEQKVLRSYQNHLRETHRRHGQGVRPHSPRRQQNRFAPRTCRLV